MSVQNNHIHYDFYFDSAVDERIFKPKTVHLTFETQCIWVII